MNFSRNSRGQYNDVVKLSVDAGKIDEAFFKKYLEDKYKIKLKDKKQFKHYDFSLNKIFKIEYKGLHYKLDTINNIAISVKDTSKVITNVIIGLDKIIYYYYRYRKNRSLKFFIFYGFIESSNDIINNNTVNYKKHFHLMSLHFQR